MRLEKLEGIQKNAQKYCGTNKKLAFHHGFSTSSGMTLNHPKNELQDKGKIMSCGKCSKTCTRPGQGGGIH